MKKLIIFLLFLVGMLSFGGMFVQAESSGEYEVKVTAHFDNANIGVEINLQLDYADRITIDFDQLSLDSEQNYQFAFWVVNGNVRSDLPQGHEFIVTNDLNIQAIYSKPGEHAVLFMDTNINLLDVQYVDDGEDASDVTEDLPDKPNYKVSTTEKWSGSLENITGSKVLILQYVIDTSATFELTVEGGSIDAYLEDGEEKTLVEDPLYNSVVTVVPDANAEPFSHWESNGVIVSFEEAYSFTVLEAKTVTAVFSETPEDQRPVIALSNALELRTGQDSYLVQMDIPEGYHLIDYGVLTSENPMLNEDMTFDNASVNRRQVSSYHGPTNEFLVTFDNNPSSVRAYMVLEDEQNNNELVYVYSEVPLLQTLFRTEYGTVFGQDAFIHYRLLINGHEVRDWVTNPTNYFEGNQSGEDFNWQYELFLQEGVVIEWKMLIRQDGQSDIWMPDPDRENNSGFAHFSSWGNEVNILDPTE